MGDIYHGNHRAIEVHTGMALNILLTMNSNWGFNRLWKSIFRNKAIQDESAGIVMINFPACVK